MPEKKSSKYLVSIFSLACLLATILVIIVNRAYFATVGDFVSYYSATSIVADGSGRNLYDLKMQHSYQREVMGENEVGWVLPFRGLSFTTLIYLPLTFFPLSQAYFIFVIFNVLMLMTIFYLLRQNFNNIKKRAPHLFFLIFLFFPIIETQVMGQLSIILTLFTLLIFILYKNKKPFWSGFVSSFFLLKPQYLIAIPFFILLTRKRGLFLLGFAISFLLLTGMSVGISGFESILNYPSFLLKTETGDYGTVIAKMLGFYSFVYYLLPNVPKSYIFLINFGVYILTIIIFNIRQETLSLERLFSAVVFLTLALAIHVWGFDYSLLIVPFYILLNNNFKSKITREGVIFLTLIFILPFLVLLNIKPFMSLILGGMGMFLLYPKYFNLQQK